MRQTYQGAIECILVDDCGTDKSIAMAGQLIAEYKGPVEFRILHHEHNRGLSAARNTGTDAATGDYIYYLDSDDYISDDCMEVLTEPLKEKDYDVVVGDFEIIGEDWGIPKLNIDEHKLEGLNILPLYCAGQIYVMVWNKLYRSEFLRRCHLYFKEGMIHEDDLFSFQAFSCVQRVFVCKEKTYKYLVRQNGIMSLKNYTLKNRDAYAETLYEMAKYLKKQKTFIPEVHECLNNRYLKLIAKISDEQNVSYFQIYRQLRKFYAYPAIKLFIEKKIKKGKFCSRFHYSLNSHMGYIYLRCISRIRGYDKI